MDRAIILLLCFVTTLCFSQRSEYLEFAKSSLIIRPQENLNQLINSPISSLYKPANRVQLSDNREKHLQLSINLFRKEHYSLLLKSMQSFERAYGKKKDYGLHQFFQMVILEKKLSQQSDIHNQIISLASRGIKEHSDNDLNLRFAFQKSLIKYYYLAKKWGELSREVKNFQKYAKGIQSPQEQAWSVQIETEVSLAKGILPQKLEELDLPAAVKASYIVYSEILSDQYIHIAKKYLDHKWHNSSQSLLNNLIFIALITENDEMARTLISQLSINLESSNQNIEFYAMILNDQPQRGFKDSRFEIIAKLMELNNKPTVTFSDEEKEIMPENLIVYIWKSRIEHFALAGQQDQYLKYLAAIPFYRLDLNEMNQVLGTSQNFLEKSYSDLYYSQEYVEIINHWRKISTKSSLKDYLNQEIKFYISAAYIQRNNHDEYYELVRGEESSLVKDLEALKSFNDQKWREVTRFASDTKRLDIMALSALSYLKLDQRKEAEAAFEKVLTHNADIKGEMKQDFFIGYIRLITSSNKTPEYVYQRLNRIKSGINHLGANSNRVNEAIEAHLIGLNMTLKKTSFENLLTSVNFFLKNYPRSQFYSMINLTRAKILAQLKKIKESMEVLQKLVKETNDEKIKVEASDELTILKNK